MKQTLLTIATLLIMFSCGTETTAEKCEKGCNKEHCEHTLESHQECAADCQKECCSESKEKPFGIGDTNPALEVKLKDISGREMHIEEIGKKTGALLIFSCNTCPFVVGNGDKSEGWENRYNDIQQLADKLDIGFALINSNEAKRENEDSFEEMVKHAKEMNYKEITYLLDEKHKVADLLNALTTPHVFLFDNQNKLVYTGAIDDNVDKKSEVKEHWLSNAMNALAEGTEITTEKTKNTGCSIKRVKK